MATRRAFSSTVLRAAAQTVVSRTARPAFAAAVSRTQLLRPTIACAARTAGSARWLNSNSNNKQDDEFEEFLLDNKTWNFEDVKQLAEGQKGKDDVVIVDVREVVELQETGKIPGAINIPITSAVQSFHIPEEDFEEMYGFERPPKDAELLFYCKAGVRARAAAGLAKHAGWENVGEYPGSWLDWEAQNGPVEKVESKEDGYSGNSQ